MPNAVSGTTQFITFSFASYLFAIPSKHIVKVVPMPSHSQGGLIDIGFVQLGQYSIQMLNLPELVELTHKLTSNEYTSKDNSFLLVLQNNEQNLFGMTLATPPDLLEIHSDKLQAVPAHQRQSGTLQWISHVATHTKTTTKKIVLMLDLAVLVNNPDRKGRENSQKNYSGIRFR